MPRFVLLLFAAVLTLAACESEPPAPANAGPAAAGAAESDAEIPFRQDGRLTFLRDGEPVQTIAIEIADTDSAITRGLMQRTSLPPESGMLFLFPVEGPRSFWMANTPIALDILFADADSQLVHVAKYTRPFSDDPVTSSAPAKFVIEVPAGFADRVGIVESDRVTWRRDAGE